MGGQQERILVTGAGGFIGHHLTTALKARGHWVRGVDIKHPEFEDTAADEFRILDLRRWEATQEACLGITHVYNLAANMGGIGFIEANKAVIMHDNVLINIHMLEAAKQRGVQRYLYTSSACVYPGYRQGSPDVVPLKEEDAYPADPEDGYGWKSFSQRGNAVTTSRTSGWRLALCAFTTSLAPWAPTMEVARSLRRPYAAKWR